MTVNEAIRLRLAFLSAEARAVLNIAAVIGNEFDSHLLAKVGQLAPHPLGAMIAEGAREGLVVALGGDRTRFAYALKDEPGTRVGIGGRARKTGSHSERARLIVSNNIRLAIAKILREFPSHGRYLSTTIHTGYFCSYHPDPDHPVAWQL